MIIVIVIRVRFNNKMKFQVANFYKGTPRDILEQHGLSALDLSAFKELPGCSLHFKLFGHRKLLLLSDLIVENSVIGRFK